MTIWRQLPCMIVLNSLCNNLMSHRLPSNYTVQFTRILLKICILDYDALWNIKNYFYSYLIFFVENNQISEFIKKKKINFYGLHEGYAKFSLLFKISSMLLTFLLLFFPFTLQLWCCYSLCWIESRGWECGETIALL